MTLLLTDSEFDANDDETDVPNAWTVDLARYKDEGPKFCRNRKSPYLVETQ